MLDHPTAAPVASRRTLTALRRRRRSRRLQDQEWFEVLYRVYLAALAGGSAVLLAAERVDDTTITPAGLDNVTTHGPAVVGLVAVLAVAAGMRSGSNGGPIAIEQGDVAFLMLAPIPRSSVLRRPVIQRLRSLAFLGAVVGGIAGQLASRRLPGSGVSWTMSGAVAGACTLVLFGAIAVLAHSMRMARSTATAAGMTLVTWQVAAIANALPGPGDMHGGLALWGMRQRPIEVIAPAASVVLVAAAVWLCGRLRLESLSRRATLVSQLRFAVTMQDLRTVVLLRRQLRGEHQRRRPWVRVPRPAVSTQPSHAAAIVRRGLHSLSRIPLTRLARVAGFAVVAGAAAVAVIRGTTPAVIAVGAALFAMSLELLEPLSQEIDHPDRGDTLPISRDRLFVHHLIAPAVAMIPFALLAAAIVTVAEPRAAPAAFLIAVPATWAAACGAVVSIVRDAPDPVARNTSMVVPPEFAGFSTAMRVLVPLAISTLGAVPVVALRADFTVETALRSLIGLILVIALCWWWVGHRDRYSASFRRFMNPSSP